MPTNISDIPKFSWIQEILRQANPNSELPTQGFDSNGDGRIEGEEELKHADNNKKSLGNVEAWQAWYIKNQKVLKSRQMGFFTLFDNWKEQFEFTNPLHDLFSIKAEENSTQDIQNSYKNVAKVLARVHSAVSANKNWSSIQKLQAVYQAMQEEKGILRKAQQDPFFATNVVMAVAHEMKWPISLVYIPNHDYIFVRWNEGKNSFNMDAGKVYSYKDFQKRFSLDATSVQNGTAFKVLSRDEMAGLYLRHRCDAKNDSQRYNGALQDCRRAFELNPQDFEALNDLGIAQKALGHYQDAIKSYEGVLQLNKNFPEALNNLGNAQFAFGSAQFAAGNVSLAGNNFSAAIENYNKAIKLKQDFPEALYNRGLVKATTRDFKGAIEDYNRIFELKLQLNPNNAEVFHHRGIAEVSIGKLEDAIGDYNEALALKKRAHSTNLHVRQDLADIFNNLGMAKAAFGDYPSAINSFTQAIEQNPIEVFFFNRGSVEARLGNQKTEAIADLKTAGKDPKLRERVKELLKDIATAEKNPSILKPAEEALEELEKMDKKQP